MDNFNGTYTPNFDFALPSLEDNVDINVLNDNLDKVDDILFDIYSKLDSSTITS